MKASTSMVAGPVCRVSGALHPPRASTPAGIQRRTDHDTAKLARGAARANGQRARPLARLPAVRDAQGPSGGPPGPVPGGCSASSSPPPPVHEQHRIALVADDTLTCEPRPPRGRRAGRQAPAPRAGAGDAGGPPRPAGSATPRDRRSAPRSPGEHPETHPAGRQILHAVSVRPRGEPTVPRSLRHLPSDSGRNAIVALPLAQ